MDLDLDLELNRRRLLGGVVLAGLGSVGLSVASIWNEPNAPPPEVPAEEMRDDGWEQTDQRQEVVVEQNAGPVTITALANTVEWENRGLVEAIRNREIAIESGGETSTSTIGEAAPDAFQQPMALFSAIRIDLGPDVDNLPLGLGRKEVMGSVESAATDQFETTLREGGMRNVERTGSRTIDIDTGESATLFEYQADFPFEGATFDVGPTSMDLPASELKIAGYLAIWHHGDHVMIAGGGHPDENYTETVEDDSGVRPATMTVDLGLTPEAYREAMLGYIRQVA